jgi:hypothetical protein
MVLMLLSSSLGAVTLAWGFAEESIGWRDPATGVTYSPSSGYPEISTIHDDLTYAMALAAGFTVADSRKLQIWNQLTDSEALPGGSSSYTNCLGTFYPTPASATFPECTGLKCAKLIWPDWSKMSNQNTCTTSRFGPYSPFFHFPHRTGALANRDIGALHDWAWGLTSALVGYEAYAWGEVTASTVMQATKRYTTSPSAIMTSIQAGSLEAFGTYLHSLADSYSHEDCIAAMDAMTDPIMPWATHSSPPIDPSVPACDYHPNSTKADDVHGREFGSLYADTQRTINASLAVYNELSLRSAQKGGKYYPLDLNTPLVVNGTPTTLSGAIEHFVKDKDYTQPDYRRTYADSLADAIVAQSRIAISPTALVLNGAVFHTDQTITYQATLTPGSTPTQVDIYLGVLLPDGVTFLSFVPGAGGTIAFAFGLVPVPFAADVPLTPTVVPFSYMFTGTEPVGTYFTYAGLAVAGSDPLQAANQLSVGVQAFQLTP